MEQTKLGQKLPIFLYVHSIQIKFLICETVVLIKYITFFSML